MIFGIGADVVELSRIKCSLGKYGDRFAKRILSNDEWPDYTSSSKPIMFLASRFAAKEALSKAIGTGLRYPVSLNYIGITHDILGKPSFVFHPKLDELIKRKGIVNCHLSISDEINIACAFVVLEK